MTRRMSPGEKLSRAFDRAKADRERSQAYVAKAKAEFEKKWAEEKAKREQKPMTEEQLDEGYYKTRQRRDGKGWEIISSHTGQVIGHYTQYDHAQKRIHRMNAIAKTMHESTLDEEYYSVRDAESGRCHHLTKYLGSARDVAKRLRKTKPNTVIYKHTTPPGGGSAMFHRQALDEVLELESGMIMEEVCLEGKKYDDNELVDMRWFNPDKVQHHTSKQLDHWKALAKQHYPTGKIKATPFPGGSTHRLWHNGYQVGHFTKSYFAKNGSGEGNVRTLKEDVMDLYEDYTNHGHARNAALHIVKTLTKQAKGAAKDDVVHKDLADWQKIHGHLRSNSPSMGAELARKMVRNLDTDSREHLGYIPKQWRKGAGKVLGVDIAEDLAEQELDESYDPQNEHSRQASADTENFINDIHKTMRAKGFKKESRRESALVHHHYTKGNRHFEISMWHGSGKGNRNYGSSKIVHSAYDSGHPNAAKEYGMGTVSDFNSTPTDETKHLWNWTKDGKYVTVPTAEYVKAHREHLHKIRTYVNGIHEDVNEEYLGFKKLAAKVHSPALAAWIGRRKYGKKKFDKAAAEGHKMKNEDTILEYHVEGHVNGKSFKAKTNDVYDAATIHSQNKHLSPDEAKAVVSHTMHQRFENGETFTSRHGKHSVTSTKNGGHFGEDVNLQERAMDTEHGAAASMRAGAESASGRNFVLRHKKTKQALRTMTPQQARAHLKNMNHAEHELVREGTEDLLTHQMQLAEVQVVKDGMLWRYEVVLDDQILATGKMVTEEAAWAVGDRYMATLLENEQKDGPNVLASIKKIALAQ